MMLVLIVSVLLILGTLSAHFKIIDLFAATGGLVFYLLVGAFFNDIYPEAPIVEAWRSGPEMEWQAFNAHVMIQWVLENGSPTANLILFSPVVYLGSKACSEIFRTLQKITKTSVS